MYLSVLKLIGAVNKLDAPADATVSAFFRQHKNLGQRERACLAETVYALLRERIKFQHLAQSGTGPVPRRLAMLAWRGNDSFLRGALSAAEKMWLEQVQAIDAASLPPRLRHNLPDWLAEPLRVAQTPTRADAIVVFAGGTGNPLFTTDTAAALRAREVGANIILKATKVDGIYSEDPEKNPHAVRYSEISYQDFLSQKLQVLDSTAILHCMEGKIPILVFNYRKEGNIERAVAGERVGTLVSGRRE